MLSRAAVLASAAALPPAHAHPAPALEARQARCLATYQRTGTRSDKCVRQEYAQYHPTIVKGCQAKNFTENEEVKAQLRKKAGDKWSMKLDYLTSRLKERIVEGKVPGAIVELGVYDGRTSRILRRFIDAFAPDREFHVYDSFAGLPSRADADGKQVRQEDGEGGMAVPQRRFRYGFERENLRLPDGIHEGFFRNISASEYPTPIAFAFFDGDLYSSVYDSFVQVYWKMSPGGIIMVHDYTDHHGRFAGVKKAVEAFLQDKAETVTECRGLIAMVVKRPSSAHSGPSRGAASAARYVRLRDRNSIANSPPARVSPSPPPPPPQRLTAQRSC